MSMSQDKIRIQDLSRERKYQLQECSNYPQKYIIVERFCFDSRIRTIVYHLEIGTQLDTCFVTIKRVKVRFSQLYEFDQRIRPEFKHFQSLSKFPSKFNFSFTESKKKEFLDQRIEDLKKYLSNLGGIPNIFKNKVFQTTFQCLE